MILAIETSSPVCSCALSANGKIYEKEILEINRHSENLGPMVGEMLSESGVSAAHLHSILISGGPGSFTGLRIGMSFAKGLAIAHETPIGLVNSMGSLIHFYRENLKGKISAEPLCIIRSHRENVFAAGVEAYRNPADIMYLNLNDIPRHFPQADLVLSNDENMRVGDLKLIVQPLNAKMLIEFHLAGGGDRPTADYEKLKLFYGMEYKAKLWKL